MIVETLSLKNFRSYDDCQLSFCEGANLVTGGNGAGKTNLVEAVYYLSLAKSWRTQEPKALIKEGEGEAVIEARINERGISRNIKIVITPKGRRIWVNDTPIRRLSELSKLVNVILFTPEDALIFKGPPGGRRNFLDVSLSKKSLDYLSLIGRYDRLLSNRNAALKRSDPDSTYISVLTESIIAVSEPIERYRRLYLNEMNKILSELSSALYGASKRAEIEFHPFIKGDNFAEEASEAYKKSWESDIIHKSTGVGIHREDFSLNLDGKDISLYGSQGENRLAAIAMKLAPYFLIDEEGKRPIAVVDDIYSELDETHAENLSNLLSDMGQVFITSTDQINIKASRIEVYDHNANRRN